MPNEPATVEAVCIGGYADGQRLTIRVSPGDYIQIPELPELGPRPCTPTEMREAMRATCRVHRYLYRPMYLYGKRYDLLFAEDQPHDPSTLFDVLLRGYRNANN